MSHSDAIAQGLRDLLRQFAGDNVPIIAAGGGPDGSLGTDGDRIEVLAGLRGGDRVVIAPPSELAAGRQIVVK